MVIGEYPCCNEPLMIAVPDRTPAYIPEDCPHCGKKVWHRLSRINPKSWLEENFLVEYDVDYESKKITEREPVPTIVGCG